MSEKPEDKKILNKLMEALHTNPNKLATELGYKSHTSIYNILNGPNKISIGLVDRIVSKFPNVNAEFLYTGKGEILTKETKNQENMLFPNRSLDRLLEIPDLLEKNNRLLEEMIELFKNK